MTPGATPLRLLTPLLLLLLTQCHSSDATQHRISRPWSWQENQALPPTSQKRHVQQANAILLPRYSKEQVEGTSRKEYIAVPLQMVLTTQVLHRGINCSAINSNLHENHIQPELQLRPNWIHTSELIGDCPTHHVIRELPSMYTPKVVMEAVCTCGGSQCSRDGHQCVPVTRHIPVWVRRGPNFHVLDVEELTVACVCVRRPSVGGNFVFNAAVQS